MRPSLVCLAAVTLIGACRYSTYVPSEISSLPEDQVVRINTRSDAFGKPARNWGDITHVDGHKIKGHLYYLCLRPGRHTFTMRGNLTRVTSEKITHVGRLKLTETEATRTYEFTMNLRAGSYYWHELCHEHLGPQKR